MLRQQPVMQNKKSDRGVTLVEVLIAMTILLIVFMGLIQASILAIGANMRNEMRDEAVRLSSELMVQLRTSPFDDINRDSATDPTCSAVSFNFVPVRWDTDGTADGIYNVRIRNATIPYTVRVTVTYPVTAPTCDTEHKQITITTTWAWQGETMTHAIVAFRGRS